MQRVSKQNTLSTYIYIVAKGWQIHVQTRFGVGVLHFLIRIFRLGYTLDTYTALIQIQK